MNEYLIFGGGGLQAEAIAYDILKFDDNSRITLADKFLDKARKVKERLKSDRVDIVYCDVGNFEHVTALMKGKIMTIGSASYEYNELLTKAAIITGSNLIDLGGSFTVVAKQFALHNEAKKAGITVLPDVGAAPGADSIVVQDGINMVGEPQYVHSFCGGIPIERVGVLEYMLVFASRGLINEYKELVEVLDNYKLKLIEPLTGIENIIIRHEQFPNGELLLEAAYTSGGSSTLAKTYEGKIKTLDYKTLRYPGHWDKMRTLYKLGFFGEEEIMGIKPRDLSEYLIDKAIRYKGKDMLILKVRVGNDKEKVDFQVVDFYNDETGHTAMQRMTGYSAAIIAEMIVDGTIHAKGVLKLEESVSPLKFTNAWSERGIHLEAVHTKKIY